VKGLWVVGIALAVLVGSIVDGCGTDTAEACHDAYVHDYVYYGEPGAMSEERYCETVFAPPSEEEIEWHQSH